LSGLAKKGTLPPAVVSDLLRRYLNYIFLIAVIALVADLVRPMSPDPKQPEPHALTEVRVSGVVLDQSDKPIEGATVAIDGEPVRHYVTSVNGSYELTIDPASAEETRTVRAQKDGQIGIGYTDRNHRNVDIRIHLERVTRPHRAEAVQPKPNPCVTECDVTGRIIEDETGKPLSEVPLSCEVAGNPSRTQTTPEGFFTCILLPNTKSSEVMVDVNIPGFKPWHDHLPPSGVIRLRH
jgi:hypothetical protein